MDLKGFSKDLLKTLIRKKYYSCLWNGDNIYSEFSVVSWECREVFDDNSIKEAIIAAIQEMSDELKNLCYVKYRLRNNNEVFEIYLEGRYALLRDEIEVFARTIMDYLLVNKEYNCPVIAWSCKQLTSEQLRAVNDIVSQLRQGYKDFIFYLCKNDDEICVQIELAKD